MIYHVPVEQGKDSASRMPLGPGSRHHAGVARNFLDI